MFSRFRFALGVSLALGAWCNGVVAQDIHYSNLSAVPMQINPAYTGLMDYRARVGLDHRAQWTNFTNGYRTTSLSADVKAWQKGADVLGVGLHINNDQAGDLNFTTQQISTSVAYLKALDRGKTFVSFGMQNVFSSQRIDWSQARGFDFEPVESLAAGGNNGFWDVGAGMAVFIRPSKRQAWFASLGGAHLNNPQVTFLGDADNSIGDRLYTKWSLHAGGEVHFGQFSSIRPSVIYLSQGPNRQIKVGSFWRYKADRGLHTDSQIAVHFGAWLRTYLAKGGSGVDAINFAARFDYDKTSIVISFDTNISGLTVASDGFGGPEVAIVQELDWGDPKKKKHKVKCPTFQY